MTENLVLAVQNAPVLRALAAITGPPPSVALVAAGVGRDPENLRKSLKLLEAEGWAERAPLGLTAAGRALLPRLAALEGGGEPATLTHAQIAPSPLNPRRDWTSDPAVEALDALRESILQEGLIQPIVVRRAADANGVRVLVAGERRWRAFGMAIADGDLPADHPIPVLLRDADDEQHRRLALIENLVRQDLHPLDEARAFAELQPALGSAQLADLAKRTARYIQQRIALLHLDEDAQDRMRLPADDPDHLTVTAARNVLQGRTETGALRSAPAGTALAQVDIEDLAPREIELTDAQQLVLLEVAEVSRLRPVKSELGPAAELRAWVNLERRPDAARLAREGLIVIGSQHPYRVVLMPAGADWIARQAWAYASPEERLRCARQRANCTAIRIAELEASGDMETDWLNPFRPTPVAAPDKRAALIRLEIVEAADVQNAGWEGAKYRPELAPADLADLAYVAGPLSGDGVPRVRASNLVGHAQLEQHYPGWAKAKERQPHIAALRADLGVTDEDKGFAPKWLRGPFSPDAAWLEKEAERMAAHERDEASRTAYEAAQERVHLELDAFERGAAAALPLAARGLRLAELAEAAGLKGPWTAAPDAGWNQPVAKAASGTGLKLAADSLSLRLALIAFNMATGVDPAAWAPTRELEGEAADAEADDALDRDAFLQAAAKHLQAIRPWLALTDADALARVTGSLDAWLESDQLEFGDPDYAWNAKAACDHAEQAAEEADGDAAPVRDVEAADAAEAA